MRNETHSPCNPHDPPHQCANHWCDIEVGGDDYPAGRYALGILICKVCGDQDALIARRQWTVLTPHKQGPMYFTKETARSAAVGINNKGGLVK